MIEDKVLLRVRSPPTQKLITVDQTRGRLCPLRNEAGIAHAIKQAQYKPVIVVIQHLVDPCDSNLERALPNKAIHITYPLSRAQQGGLQRRTNAFVNDGDIQTGAAKNIRLSPPGYSCDVSVPG